MSAIARQRLDFLVVILVLVLVSQRDVPVRVPGQDGETASIEAAVIKPSEGAARAYRDRLYVIPVEEVDWMPPFEHHLDGIKTHFKLNKLKQIYTKPLQQEPPASTLHSRHHHRPEHRDGWELLGKSYPI